MKSFTIPALFATAVIASGCTLSPLEEDVAYERRDLWRQPAITNIGAPAVDDSALYVIDLTGAVSRLSRKDGSVVWRQPSNPAGTPRGLVRGGNTILMSASELIAFAIADGSILWRQSNAAGVGELESAALGNLVVPSIYRGSGDALALDELTGREVWRGTMGSVPTSVEIRVSASE
ncbi:MAG: PQQ-binding-like beta-propeller repeat protein [Gemmatimonadaceae bacterium]|nr:PQQ-binding-like beta-propeller repeat protein [Gemmatimonadaceae bacterium]